MKFIDLNADVGEATDYDLQEQLLQLITSANIACGGHAGDADSIRLTVEQCLRHHVAIGAHPSYPDRENFGRAALAISKVELTASIAVQLNALGPVTHVKAHGALYNEAAKNPEIAQAIADAIAHHPVSTRPVLYGLKGSLMLDVFQKAGFRTAREVFADRAYQPDGSLRPRHLPGALITDPDEAAANAVKLAEDADTICIHSDTLGAVQIAHAVRRALEHNGYRLRPV